jgi:hypothetical protein
MILERSSKFGNEDGLSQKGIGIDRLYWVLRIR